MARATSSLPVPDSPVISTVDLVGAALETISSTRCMALPRPTMFSVANRSSKDWRNSRFSRWAAANRAAFSMVRSSSSLAKGLAM